MRIKPRALDGLWHPNSRMLKTTSIGGVCKKLEVLDGVLPRDNI